MYKIDSHQHFWQYNPVKDSWITDEMAVLKNNFLPADLKPELESHGFEGCVTVQAGQTEDESLFLVELTEQNSFIKGVVGWVDLVAENVEERLNYFSQYEKLKGFRHILQGETNRAYMLQPEFKHGIAKLKQFDFTYDILINNDQLIYISEFVDLFPDQLFVIDHLAKPNIKAKEIEEWKKYIIEIAKRPNVYCKVSGMVTEADWANWQPADLHPYLDVVFEAFSAKRVMYGSDWPVCLLAATYSQWYETIDDYCSRLSESEQELFWSGNAISFYNLKN
ncbi:amidohydrolase [Mucilaginibacter limnophilus]|uniref:Amidohydrolase n=1 Tax=Mucilaginibacter limnophilus TaxID=1932778 RepID=A0A3S2V7J3_9SPHI|nr:amidohydrolase family protein [Mucilaginibacter limnophilus]RVU00458.1 amidohydrolase [Mucilaginibacter limnophilus]